jgi:hypothetical protein
VPATVSSVAVAGSPTQVSYVAGDAATVILDSGSGALRIVDFTPHPGWFTVRLEQPSLTQLRVRLQSATASVTFSAQLADGVIATSLSADPAPSSSAPSDSAPGGTGPGNSAPGNSAPGNSAPGNSAPGNTAPGGGDDDDDGSGRGGDDDPPGDDSGGSGGGGSDDNSGPG